MKRFVASVGLVALGTCAVRADSDSGLTQTTSKPWTVSATLRGFYDDNLNALPSGSTPAGVHRDTFGFEVSPAVSVVWPWEQTTLSAGYIYSFKDYQYKPIGNTTSVDMTHSFNVSLAHAFNELYQANISDSFVIGQEPDFLRAGNTYSTFQRLSGNNIRNYGSFVLDGKVTPLVGFEVGYANAYYNYAASSTNLHPGFVASPAGELNLIQHTVHLDSRWQLSPETVGVIGYQFMDIDYYADQIIALGPPTTYTSSSRDSYGHYGYVGVDQTFAPSLTGSVRAGVRDTEYYNDPGASDRVSPYALMSLSWTYAYESSVSGGFSYDREPCDLVGNSAQGLTLDSKVASVYAQVTHRLAPNLFGNLNGQYQHNTYSGGAYNGEVEQFYTFGANLQYRFNNYFSSQIGYNYDRLDSGISTPASGGIGSRSFDRNRVYVGVTASY